MSVTLINQELGNFDNVVFMHNHFTSENLYQLCRFLFNYMSWSEENKSLRRIYVLHPQNMPRGRRGKLNLEVHSASKKDAIRTARELKERSHDSLMYSFTYYD